MSDHNHSTAIPGRKPPAPPPVPVRLSAVAFSCATIAVVLTFADTWFWPARIAAWAGSADRWSGHARPFLHHTSFRAALAFSALGALASAWSHARSLSRPAGRSLAAYALLLSLGTSTVAIWALAMFLAAVGLIQVDDTLVFWPPMLGSVLALGGSSLTLLGAHHRG